MQATSPWESDFRSDFRDLRSERSISAPPPDTNLFLGQNENGLDKHPYLGSNMAANDKLNPFFDNQKRGPSDSLILDANNSKGKDSISTSLDQTLGFSSAFPSRIDNHYNTSRFGSSDDTRQIIGRDLIRSHSATPTLDGTLSRVSLPGLENSETPVLSNATTDSYLESDRSRLQLGQRRPASTGVIGGSQSSSSSILQSLGSHNDAVRPAAKTLMDLIQEDFPPEPPSDACQNDYSPRVDIYQDRPRTTSPLLQQSRDHSFIRNGQYVVRDGRDDSTDRFHISKSDQYNAMDVNRQMQQYPFFDSQVLSQTQLPFQAEDRVQNSIHGSVASHPQSHPQPHQIRMQNPAIVHTQQHRYDHHQQTPYEQQPIYGTQPHVHSHRIQTQVLTSGHAIYMDAPSHHPYGYATAQYHPHSQQPHMVHQTNPGAMSPHREQYISIVPVQGSGVPVQTVAAGGAYAFWQPGGQTLTLVNAHAPRVPVTVARVGQPRGDSPRRHQGAHPHRGGGRNKQEKGSKARRGETGSARAKNQSTPVHSSLLDDFKSKKNRDWTIFQIRGHVVEFCQDQNGSRFIQQRLQVGDMGEKEVVSKEVLPSVHILRNDVFGNYVVQKLMDFGTPAMRVDIQERLQGEMLQLSLQMYGCRVVQKSLETLDDDDFSKLLAEFHNNILSCIHDQNGNHVIQKCIEVISEKSKLALLAGDHVKADFLSEQIDFIVDDVLRNVISLSCHPYGCRVLQRILEHCIEPKKNRALDEVRKYHKTLLDDQYGNYVIQHVLQFGRSSDRDSILQIVVANGLLLLSRQKFASNVVEKLLKYGNGDQRKRVVREMLKVVDESTGNPPIIEMNGCSVVLLMVRDAYANYVVQTTLDVISDCEEKVLLLEELNSHATELKNLTFAKHIVIKLEA